MNQRCLNFNAGPSALPLQVLEQIQKDLICYPGCGCSILEMSHRTKEFETILNGAKADLKELMAIDDRYEILFMQGGASLQFSSVVMNLASRGQKVSYLDCGNFAHKAIEEAQRWADVVVEGSTRNQKYTMLPYPENIHPDSAYLHFTGNNTIYGTSYHNVPYHGSIPLVADWSSAILGQHIDVNDYALIYAGAQKNIAPAGLTVVIIRKDMLDREIDPLVPTMMRYKIMADNNSMYNTPPVFSIYAASLVLKWLKENGGVAEMEKRNIEKSSYLYDYLDHSTFYQNKVKIQDRSIMNVPFVLNDDSKTPQLIEFAKEKGVIGIKGHRATGGCRASLYNAVELSQVKKLVEILDEFAERNK